jgi:hypothetical protein
MLIGYVGASKDGPMPLGGPTRPRTLLIEVGTGSGPSPIQSELEIT